MRFTLFILTVTLLTSDHQVFAGDDDIDPPLNPTNKIQSFSFERQPSWTNQDFEVTQDDNHAHVMSIEAHLKDQVLAHFALDLNLASGEQIKIKINRKVVNCGFKQTYKMSNGVQFLIDPRGPLTDRWHIKQSGYIKQKYTWMRKVQGLSGILKSDDGRKVAYFSGELISGHASKSFQMF
ncbi:hypothetical protein PTTG_28579 [Puccinia triticina 1-1 BBBD Race 1]|uniref:Uncharacterized protein n=2 Tax=Puccinia triticina TaxID=208348 RepID=A0A180GAJ9_PUCT1|nr:uncharacterized protein PtA15_13A276 [Puccinia triticina]OAV89736.1 hypothetical protein PTTG_28579 [Puccinia triticina 1-1 BBBD Race 1]WAQ90876.1 hypothetical protein PtA15_13A276 [Puccinia triticina]WAR61069.1 hypothetical protein PtB15_13B321 [Puccinia triticina]